MACDEYCRVSRQQIEQRAEQAERERDEARAKVEKLEAALEPGKASAIVAGLFALANRHGMPWTSSEAPTSYLHKLILSLTARAALEDK